VPDDEAIVALDAGAIGESVRMAAVVRALDFLRAHNGWVMVDVHPVDGYPSVSCGALDGAAGPMGVPWEHYGALLGGAELVFQLVGRGFTEGGRVKR
jgi:hypothetical protein